MPVLPKLSPTVSLVLATALVAAVALQACGPRDPSNVGPNAQSPERQSEAEYDLARDFFYKANPRAALDHALRSVELNDDNSKALYFTAAIYLFFCSGPNGMQSPDCRLQDAEKYARAAVKAESTFRDAKNMLGQVLILRDKPADAIAYLEPLTRDPAYAENHLAWGNLGWAQVQLGKLDDGIASLKNSITQPRFCVGHYRLGVAYEKKGDLGQADAAFTAALSVDSPDCQNLQDAWEGRARVRTKLGRIADARADFEKCREIAADSQTGKRCSRELAGPGDPGGKR
ncbi:MAG: tetratricopeptide repeat protein [Polyangiaceae bacterium]